MNPVTYSDPSGYLAEGTLSSQVAVMGIMTVLTAVVVPNLSHIVDSIGFLLTEIYDTCAIATDTIVEWAEGVLNGTITSANVANDVKNDKV